VLKIKLLRKKNVDTITEMQMKAQQLKLLSLNSNCQLFILTINLKKIISFLWGSLQFKFYLIG